MGGAFLRKFLADAGQRLLLVLIAATLTGIVAILLCSALVAGLAQHMPIWAALVVTAIVLLLLALLALLIATRSQPKDDVDNDMSAKKQMASSQPLLALLTHAIKENPKTTMGFALLTGVVIGTDPSLRADIMKLIWTHISPPDDDR